MSDKNPNTPDNSDEIAKELLEQVNVFVQAENPIIDLERQWKEEAKGSVQEAEILTEADNAILNASEPEPEFVPSQEQSLLFGEVNAIVETANDLYNGSLEADHHYRHLEKDLKEPGEYNPESVIDERIKEDQKDDVEDAFKNELVDALS